MHIKRIKYLFAAFVLLVFSALFLPARNGRKPVARINSVPAMVYGTDSLLVPVIDTLESIPEVPDTSLSSVKYASTDTSLLANSVIDSMVSTDPVMDSVTLAAIRDSLHRADSLFREDSLIMLGKSSLEQPAFSGAKDSIIEVFSNGQKKVYYYGDVEVTYHNMKLTADYMEYDLDKGEVFARGTWDTLSKTWKGQPVMTQGSDTYDMEELRYNFNSKKARITNMITSDADGKLHGQNIKMMPDRSINMTKGKYTVCDAEHPHYYMSLSTAKVITKPTQKTVFGPAGVVVEDVHLPIGLPFGFIPKKPERSTGLLIPTFGEENARGFYARDGGFYFVIGDFFDISLTGSYYTLGSWGVDLNSRYKVNYKFSGNFGLNFSNDQTGEVGSTDFFQSRNFGVKWSHSQDAKARPGTTFSASVNFSSPSNNRFNSTSVNEALQNQISSSISYGKRWNKVNLSINALHNQNSRDSSYSFTLPNLTLSLSTIYPFKQKTRVGKEKFYEKISFGYNTSFQNKVNFKASEFAFPEILEKFQSGMRHNFSIGLPSFTVAKYLNFNPGISYGQNWYFTTKDYEYNPETDKVEAVEAKKFSTLGISQTYSGSISMTTRLYGNFNFKKYNRIQAIRHVISPSISFSASPELGTYANGWRTLNYVNNKGEEKTYEYNRYAGQMNSPPGKGKSASANISIGNNLEAKVRDFADTSGSGTKKIKIIDQLNFNTGWNFLADSLNMSQISASFSTSVFGKMSINASASFDPYAINEKGQRINTFNIVKEGFAHPLRLNSASASTSYSFAGKGTINGNDGSNSSDGGSSPADYYKRIYYHPVTGEYIPGGWLYYTNPNVPWSLNFSYSFNYSRSYSYTNNQLIANNRYTQTLSVSGNIQLTPKMSIQGNTGLDLMAMKMTTSQLSATYDLHCFNIAVSWVPMGTWQSYSFRIAANASTLADILKFKKNSSYWDNR